MYLTAKELVNCKQDEEDWLMRGYLDGYSGEVLPRSTDPYYRHGYRNGRNDRKGIADPAIFPIIRELKELRGDV